MRSDRLDGLLTFNDPTVGRRDVAQLPVASDRDAVLDTFLAVPSYACTP
jgi:hypothetical protein